MHSCFVLFSAQISCCLCQENSEIEQIPSRKKRLKFCKKMKVTKKQNYDKYACDTDVYLMINQTFINFRKITQLTQYCVVNLTCFKYHSACFLIILNYQEKFFITGSSLWDMNINCMEAVVKNPIFKALFFYMLLHSENFYIYNL